MGGEEGLLGLGMAIRWVASVRTSTMCFSCCNSSRRAHSSPSGTAHTHRDESLRLVPLSAACSSYESSVSPQHTSLES